jgi:hypothetical protein
MRRTRLGLRMARWLGSVLNLAGLPGFVRAGTYESAYGDVAVRVSSLFTVVSIDGLEVFFYRLSGAIDGVSITARRDYTGARTRSPVRDSAASAPE